MRLSRLEMEKISKFITKEIRKSSMKITDEGRITPLIIGILEENMDEEKRLEEDALKLLQQHKKQMGSSIDHNKALRMIKEKLAKERGFKL